MPHSEISKLKQKKKDDMQTQAGKKILYTFFCLSFLGQKKCDLLQPKAKHCQPALDQNISTVHL